MTLSLLALCSLAAAQEPSRRALGDIPAATGEIAVDGRLDEPAWASALVLDLAVETWATVNEPAPAATAVYLLYGEDRLYVGFRATDPDPATIRAVLADRDSETATSGDLAGVILDPYGDGRSGYGLMANPLGVQVDLVINEVAGVEDTRWDALWDSAGRLTDTGYEVELVIPFSSLRFPKAEGPQTWAFDAFRIWPRDKVYRMAVNPIDRDVACTLCQFGLVGGLSDIKPGHSLVITPTLTLTQPVPPIDSEDPWQPGGLRVDPGLTARWAPSSNLVLLGALNPDFSQVEADAVQLAVNRQFSLYYTEKRPFFLEGAEAFQTPIEAFYSRTIADPQGGLKVVGRSGGGGYGALATRDAITNLVLPGSQYSADMSLDDPSWAGVGRWQQALGESSAVGGLVTARATETGYINAVAGIDGLARLTDSDELRVQALGSATELPDEVVATGAAYGLSQPDELALDYAALASYAHGTERWAWTVDYKDIGEDFRADLGYVPQVGYRSGKAALQHNWLGQAEDWYSNIALKGTATGAVSSDGELLEARGRLGLGVEAVAQTSVILAGEARRLGYAGQDFDQLGAELSLVGRPTRTLSYGLDAIYGGQIDYYGVRPGRNLSLAPSLGLLLGRHVALSVLGAFEHMTVEPGALYTATAGQVRAIVHLNGRTFVRVLVQVENVDYMAENWLFAVPDHSTALSDQLLLSYKLGPQTLAFLGWSDSWDLTEEATLVEGTVFAKLSYAWQP